MTIVFVVVCIGLSATVLLLVAERMRLIKLLRVHEFGGEMSFDYEGNLDPYHCPVCWGTRVTGHTPKCEVAHTLKENSPND